MKIRHRLSLQFTLITGILLTGICVMIYFFSARYIRNSFYRMLETRAQVTAEVFLEKDEVTKKKFREIEKRYQQSIPHETSNIYDSNNKPVFIEKVKYTWPTSLLNDIRERQTMRFTFRDKYGMGIFYKDNQGDFVVIVTARNIAGEAQLRHLLWLLATVCAGGLLLIFFLGQWFARRALRPVDSINRQVKNIRANNLHERVQRSQFKDEVDELAVNFNELLEHLEQAFEMQKSFVSNASHELRTPLTTIIVELEVTLHRQRSIAEYEQALRSVLDESVKLKVITDGLLQLTRLEALPEDASSSFVRLDELLYELQDHWQRQSPPGRLDVQLRRLPDDPALLTLRANRQLLTLALQNVIQNAFKFSDYRPVTASLTWHDNGMVLSVSDNGTGIPAADLEKIFLPLFRGENARTYSGYGIGLPMARKIFLLHRATVTVSSVPGSGTTFNIFFAPSAAF